MKIIVRILLETIPKQLISNLVGLIAAVKMPKFMRSLIYPIYAKFYALELAEAEKDLTEYPTFKAFFARRLKPGVRPIGPGLISPVDGCLNAFGQIQAGSLHQIKGWNYSLSDLLQNQALAKQLEGGQYATIYLAPGDYHRIHAPLSGSVTSVVALPGKLFPVNQLSLNAVADLFVRNKRVVLSFNAGQVVLVIVGALNVGSIELFVNAGAKVEKGQEIASFNLGSTVVLLLAPQVHTLTDNISQQSIFRVGMTIAN
ncbi:phosphatidylserine decarboxylase [bacterium]|nr:phosphatidylserine decarboxylase [bacterium]